MLPWLEIKLVSWKWFRLFLGKGGELGLLILQNKGEGGEIMNSSILPGVVGLFKAEVGIKSLFTDQRRDILYTYFSKVLNRQSTPLSFGCIPFFPVCLDASKWLVLTKPIPSRWASCFNCKFISLTCFMMPFRSFLAVIWQIAMWACSGVVWCCWFDLSY